MKVYIVLETESDNCTYSSDYILNVYLSEQEAVNKVDQYTANYYTHHPNDKFPLTYRMEEWEVCEA